MIENCGGTDKREMNQALEIDILKGFNSEEMSHLMWVIDSSIEEAYEQLKKAREHLIDESCVNNYLEDGIITTDILNSAIKEAEALGVFNAYTNLKALIGTGNYCPLCGYREDKEVKEGHRCATCGGVLFPYPQKIIKG